MKKTIRDYDLNQKKVIIRCDFNVPIKDNKITDENRIVESLKTITYAIENNAKVILMSHLSKVKTEEDKLKNSLRIVSERLSYHLNKEVKFVPYTRGEELENAISFMQPKDVILIENTRFEDLDGKKESSNDLELGNYWASLGDIFINDAVGTSHRKHASNVGIASNLPSGIGFLIEKEITNLSTLNNPKRPYYVILGGAKISDKIEIVSSLVKEADKIIIGGGMAYTFLKSKGINIGNSICDEESIEFAKKMLKEYSEKIVLPIDSKVTKIFEDTLDYRVVDNYKIENDDIALDIGPLTIENIKKELSSAKTIFWNGTLGYSEFTNFKEGTESILEFITNIDAVTVLGGGDTVAAATNFGYKEKVSYASTGGGATLEYISKKQLPGIEIIDEK